MHRQFYGSKSATPRTLLHICQHHATLQSLSTSSHSNDTTNLATQGVIIGDELKRHPLATLTGSQASRNPLESSLNFCIQNNAREASKVVRKKRAAQKYTKFNALENGDIEGGFLAIRQNGNGKQAKRLQLFLSKSKTLSLSTFDRGIHLVAIRKAEELHKLVLNEKATTASSEIQRDRHEKLFGFPCLTRLHIHDGVQRICGAPIVTSVESRPYKTEAGWFCSSSTGTNERNIRLSRHRQVNVMGKSATFGLSWIPLDQHRGIRLFSNSYSSRTAIRNSDPKSSEFSNPSLSSHIPVEKAFDQQMLGIRKQLKNWETANALPKTEVLYWNSSNHTALYESMLQIHDKEHFSIDSQESKNQYDEVDDLLLGRDDLLDGGDCRSFLVRGDLTVLMESRRLQLATFIGHTEFHSHNELLGRTELQFFFYTMDGRLLKGERNRTKLFAPSFFSLEELDCVLRLRSNEMGTDGQIPRHIGAPLVEKMSKFWEDSDQFYRENASLIDRTHELFAHENTQRVVPISEIAEEILPLRTQNQGEHSKVALLSLYRSCCDKIGFTPDFLDKHGSPLVVVHSMETVRDIKFVGEEVRKWQDIKSSTPSCQSSFSKFILKAQRLIDQSRKLRDLTPYGMLGPLKPEARVCSLVEHIDYCFSDTDLQYINFLKTWTSNKIPQNSRESAVGSAILRATEKYPSMDLNESTAWVFLQELGAMSPFANPAAMLLNVSLAGGILPQDADEQEQYIGRDKMSHLRKDWGSLPVYCIDQIGAEELDDGLSIHPADVSGEYWVHIHTAHPGSQIAPDGELAAIAKDMMESIYLPEQVVRMLPRSISQEKFSLASDQPTLTYSTRLNVHGDIQEYLITPGIIRNVICLTPDDVDDIVYDRKEVGIKREVIKVGSGDFRSNKRPKIDGRSMTPIQQLSPEDLENIRLLHRLGMARENRAAARGGLTPEMKDAHFRAAMMDNTSTNLHSFKPVPAKTCFRVNFDPDISLTSTSQVMVDSELESAPMVRIMMLLAGEVAARWCHERQIPVPFRVNHRNEDMRDPAEYYRKEIQTRVAASEEIPYSVIRNYLAIIGNVRISSTAGPHLALGLEMFARLLSMTDVANYQEYKSLTTVLGFWQIQAALIEEAESGVSLVRSNRVDYLPFTKAQVDEYLVHAQIRESGMKLARKVATQFWNLQLLVRAWKYNEARLPETFECRVTRLTANHAKCLMPYLGLGKVQMKFPKWMKKEDVKLDDLFEVEIESVDVYKCQAYANPLRRIKTIEACLT